MEHLPKYTIFWPIKQVSMNFKGFKSYSSQTIKELNRKSIMERYVENPQIFGQGNSLVKEEIKREVGKYFLLN